jgi:fumarate hydratase class II
LRVRHRAERQAHQAAPRDSLLPVTALNPRIGYKKAAQISLLAYGEDLSLKMPRSSPAI